MRASYCYPNTDQVFLVSNFHLGYYENKSIISNKEFNASCSSGFSPSSVTTNIQFGVSML